MFDSKNERLIVETFFRAPERTFYLRELAEETGISASTVSRIVKKLDKRGILEVEKDLKMKIFASGKQFKNLKRAYNLWKLEESNLIDEIQEKSVPEAIILFGSYSRGEDKEKSDIDIAVINGRKPEIKLSKHEEKLGRKISIQTVDRQQIGNNFLETISNGITLRGHLEL